MTAGTTSASIEELLSARLPDQHPDADPSLPQNELQYFDDRQHAEYEWIRLPRRRNFDIFAVPAVPPEDRNHAQVPLTCVRAADGRPVTVWAKMDTGADANTIHRSTVTRLLGDALPAALQPVDPSLNFAVQGRHAALVHPRHTVTLSFTAGAAARHFPDVMFYVLDDDDADGSGDGAAAAVGGDHGVAEVLLGYDTLRRHAMVMVDLEYYCDADPALPVLAPRVEFAAATEEIMDLQIVPRVKGLSPEPRRVTHGGLLLPGRGGGQPGLVRLHR